MILFNRSLLQSAEDLLPGLITALAVLIVGWLLARLAAAATRRMLQHTGLDRRLAAWAGQEEEAEAELLVAVDGLRVQHCVAGPTVHGQRI